jgi:poly(3-hydroxybutyrate) depolymerase
MGPGGYYGLLGESNGEAILVSPEGLVFSGFGGNSLGWANTGGRDIAFFEAMLERFKTEMCIDESRIFSTGFSFGGMMSYALGCGAGDLVRAIAPMAGNLMGSGCEPGTTPVAMMAFHGSLDDFVFTADGRTARDVFVERNGCTDQTTPLDVYCDDAGANAQPCTCVSYEGCMDDKPAIWCEFNGGHTPAPNSAAAIWDFFSQF